MVFKTLIIKCVICIFIVLISGQSIASFNCNDFPKLKYGRNLTQNGLTRADLLLGLLNNEIEGVKNSLIADLTVHIYDLDSLLKHGECFTELEITNSYKTLILLSVLHEKKMIVEWEKDATILKIFKQSHEYSKEYLEKSRKRDWSSFFN